MMGMRRGRECTNRDSVDDGDEKRKRVYKQGQWMMGMRRGRESQLKIQLGCNMNAISLSG